MLCTSCARDLYFQVKRPVDRNRNYQDIVNLHFSHTRGWPGHLYSFNRRSQVVFEYLLSSLSGRLMVPIYSYISLGSRTPALNIHEIKLNHKLSPIFGIPYKSSTISTKIKLRRHPYAHPHPHSLPLHLPHQPPRLLPHHQKPLDSLSPPKAKYILIHA